MLISSPTTNTGHAAASGMVLKDDYVRLLVSAVATTRQSEENIENSQGRDAAKIYRFVLPVPLCSMVHDLCQKIEGRLLTKLPDAPTSVHCQSVFMLNSDNAIMLEDECHDEEKLDQWFQRQYQIENDQTVSMCFRDFDKITCRLTINRQENGLTNQSTSLITQSAPKSITEVDTNKRKQKQNSKESEHLTEPDTQGQKLSKNARKKAKRRQEEEDKVVYNRKMSQLRVILRNSINGYSQEEASRCVSNSQDTIESPTTLKKDQSCSESFSDKNKEYSDIERVLRLNSSTSGKLMSSGSECSCN